MAKGFAIHNAPTDHGGLIPATQFRDSQMGNAFVRAGDGHFCPKCKCWSTVIKSHDHVIIDGKPVAYVGDKLTCGARIQPQQSHVVGDSGGTYYDSSSPILQTVNSQQSLNNSFTNDRKFEHYYIERNKTDYVKFKTGLPPYDEDKKGWVGLGIQMLSGACEFIVTYIVKDRNLFITVSYVPPVVKNDASKIIPFATVRLYKESNRKFELLGIHRLKSEGGIWNTERGREPVGFSDISLPKPDLSLLKVELEMGYEAIFDGGKVVPTPSFVKYSFTLNSAARQIQ